MACPCPTAWARLLYCILDFTHFLLCMPQARHTYTTPTTYPLLSIPAYPHSPSPPRHPLAHHRRQAGRRCCTTTPAPYTPTALPAALLEGGGQKRKGKTDRAGQDRLVLKVDAWRRAPRTQVLATRDARAGWLPARALRRAVCASTRAALPACRWDARAFLPRPTIPPPSSPRAGARCRYRAWRRAPQAAWLYMPLLRRARFIRTALIPAPGALPPPAHPPYLPSAAVAIPLLYSPSPILPSSYQTLPPAQTFG